MFEIYIDNLMLIMTELKRVLRDDGTMWINLGDVYAGSGKGVWSKRSMSNKMGQKESFVHTVKPKIKESVKRKSLCCIPDRFKIRMVDDGWCCRNDIIWEKPNAKPENVMDRFVVDYERIFFFTKNPMYWFKKQTEPALSKYEKRTVTKKQKYSELGHQAHSGWIGGTPGIRNKRSVWSIHTTRYPGAHHACVDAATEILTKDGWRNHDSIGLSDKIATFNIMRETIHYHYPYLINKYEYTGEMIRIKNQYIDQLITLNHRVLLKYLHGQKNNYKRRIDNCWNYEKAENLKAYSGMLIPNAGKYDDSAYKIGIYKAELLGWILTEGSIRNGSIIIYQSLSTNPDKVDRIRYLLKQSKQAFKEKTRERLYNGKKNKSTEFSLNKTENNNSWIFRWIDDKKLPKWQLLHLINNDLNALFKGLIGGDGHRRSDGRISFIQKNEYSQLWFRTLCTHLGLRTSLHRRTRISSCLTSHVTNHNYSQIHQSNFKECVYKENYSGIVWCPSVPNTNFIAKRNNKIYITGNTFPEELLERPIDGGCPPDGVVLDPFSGSGTTLMKAHKMGRKFIGIDVSSRYADLATKRIQEGK